MSADARILVATDVADDAEMVEKLLREEFDNVFISSNPEKIAADFEKYQPNVLVLAFNTLEKAERYYLGLYRLSTLVHALPHRTLILCSKDDLQRVFELCRKEYFDDYILFWPMAHDAPRLRMAIHQALRQMAASTRGMPTAGEFAAQARRIAGLEALLEQSIARGGEHIDGASHSLKQAEQDIDLAIDSFSRKLADGGRPDLVDVRDPAGLQREINRLKSEEIGKRIRSVAAAVQPMRQWAQDFQQKVAPHLESTRALGAMGDLVRPAVLIVDDDAFQRKLLGQLLNGEELELVYAESGTGALSMLHKRRPDLILMDVMMPDIDGIEVTRRLKLVEQYAAIPVIMITGQSEKNVVVKSLKAGAVDFVVKPFDRDTLIAKLRKYLKGIRA